MTIRRISRIGLLTGLNEAPDLVAVLQRHNTAVEVLTLHDRESLDRFAASVLEETRLIAVCSSVIVPRAYLERLPGPAYNFHPGPPTRPGRYPTVFALYHGDTRFGITVHEMAPKVDAGSIVAVEHFDMPDGGLAALEVITVAHVVAAFARLAPHLACDPSPLPRVDAQWSGAKTTLADAAALGRITPDLSPDEVARRRFACGGLVTEAQDPGWIDQPANA